MRTPTEFEAALRQVCQEKYWHNHPFHHDLHDGRLTKPHIQLWVSNRWYYQQSLPQKDAAIVANCPVGEVRRRWIRRIAYQDGAAPGEGGLESWLRLGEAVGLSREAILDQRHLAPAVRFATDAYVNFARTRPWVEAVAASLTELFSADLMQTRLAAFREHYAWIRASGHEYFASRSDEARKDASHALQLVLDWCRTPAEQDAAIAALQFKCEVLMVLLDAIDHAARGSRA
jgi:pyrroloquinoline-quinone synthase